MSTLTCEQCGGAFERPHHKGMAPKFCSSACRQRHHRLTHQPEPDWHSIANELREALASFMAYDGYGEGGAADSNRGDWRAAEAACDRYDQAVQ